nr:MAG TPA: hypothetical protein [Caudoviricetes sp.]
MRRSASISSFSPGSGPLITNFTFHLCWLSLVPPTHFPSHWRRAHR